MGWLLLKALTLLVAAWLIVTWIGTAESADLRDAQWISHQRALRDAGELWDVPTPLRSGDVHRPQRRCPPPTGLDRTEGWVTWYGGHPLLDYQLTAWGEVYDPNDPTTAASALLQNAAGAWVVPLWWHDTRLRVCTSSACIVVRVTDTCLGCLQPREMAGGGVPYLLDLSRAAFGQLAPNAVGVLYVTIEVLE